MSVLPQKHPKPVLRQSPKSGRWTVTYKGMRVPGQFASQERAVLALLDKLDGVARSEARQVVVCQREIDRLRNVQSINHNRAVSDLTSQLDVCRRTVQLRSSEAQASQKEVALLQDKVNRLTAGVYYNTLVGFLRQIGVEGAKHMIETGKLPAGFLTTATALNLTVDESVRG